MKKLSIRAINFWRNEASNLHWDKYFKKVYKPVNNIINKKRINGDWFLGGKISLYDNLITKHLKNNVNRAAKIAITTVSKNKKIKSYTYKNLNSYVLNFEKFFLKLKNKKSLKVMIHASSSIESAVSMLCCTKLGIEFSVLFENLESDAIVKRVLLFKPNFFFTRLKKEDFIKKNHDKFSVISKKTKIIFFENINFKKKINKKNQNISFESNRNLFTLFTSGSTGVPKGVTHSIGGYSVFCYFTAKSQFGFNNNSVILCASDAGWINGHTYALYSPLFFGAETILIEDPFILFNEKLFHKILKCRKVSILYLPVTLIRLQKSSFNLNFKSKYLKTIGSMGEHLASDIANWYSKYFNLQYKAVVNTYFQTETGGVIISPKYSQNKKEAPDGSVGSPACEFIIHNKLNRKNKKEIKILSPFPGLMKSILSHKKESQKYFDSNNNFRMFDVATINIKNIYIHGRNDDVINVRGHRIGCEEIEKVVMEIDDVIENAVVASNDKIEGNIIYLFVVSKNKFLNKIINNLIKKNFGIFAVPKKIFYVRELPKTRSGKILRRTLRNVMLKNDDLGDLSTIRDKDVINEIREII